MNFEKMLTMRTDLLKLMDAEIKRSIKKHGPLKSAHEAYAVILEEVEEADREVWKVKASLEAFWTMVKGDAISTLSLPCDIERYALNAAAEYIQVAAVARKFVEQEKPKTDAHE